MSKGFGRLLGAVALAFAVTFSAIAGAQYWFLRNQLCGKLTVELSSLARDMKDDLAFVDSWNLEGYRRTTSGPDIYLIVTRDGTLIDTHGYLPGMIEHVETPFKLEFDRSFQFTSELGEMWNLYIRPLRDGIVILGARAEITPSDAARRLPVIASRFGANVSDAMGLPERAVDEFIDYAVIDATGTLRYANGGLPLRTAPPTIPDNPVLNPTHEIDGMFYLGYSEPIVSRLGQKVAIVTVLEDETGERRLLRQAVTFNVVMAIILWLASTGLAAVYLRRAHVAGISCAQIPSLDESDTVEFKSSLRWDYNEERPNPVLEKQVIKAVVGFLNSESGGNLLIGVSDDKQVLGLERDYSTLNTKPNRDGFHLKLEQVLINAFGERCCSKWIKISFCSTQGKDICVVTVSPATELIYAREKDTADALFVRIGNSTRTLSAREAAAYAASRSSIRPFRWPDVTRQPAI